MSCFSFQPVLHDWCNTKGSVLFNDALNTFSYGYMASDLVQQRPWYVLFCQWGDAYKKGSLLLIGKRRSCGGSGFPLLLSEWSFTICLMPYNLKYNVLSASLYKSFPSFLRISVVQSTRKVRWIIELLLVPFSAGVNKGRGKCHPACSGGAEFPIFVI